MWHLSPPKEQSFEGLLWLSLWEEIDSVWSMCNWEVRSISSSFCISFFFPETSSAPARACSHCFSLFPKRVKAHYKSSPSFLPVTLTLWEVGGGKSCTLLLLWFNPVVLWSRAWCLKTRQPFSSSYKPFAIPLSLSSPSPLFFFACAYWSHLCHSLEILLAAAHLKHRFWSLRLCSLDKLRCPEGLMGFL